MKKTLFLIPAFAVALASCSNDEAENQPDAAKDLEANYLSISLVPAPDKSTRDGSDYEDGTSIENAVESIRFYFFNSQDEAISVKADGHNYLDLTKDEISSEGNSSENVEKLINAVVVINTKDGDTGLPSKIVAILNPNTANLGKSDLSLSDLRGGNYDIDYASVVNRDANSNFVMNNSVYESEGKELVSTSINPESFGKTPAQALAKPVNIYVERNVAKIRLSLDKEIADNDGRVALNKDKEGTPLLVGEKRVYLTIKNWGITADTDKSRFFKTIDVEGWSDDNDGLVWTWNYEPYFRSFWAVNAENANQKWHSYNDIESGEKDLSANNFIYANENAPQQDYNTLSVEKFTKVIMIGILEDEEGEPLDITKYAGLSSVATDADEDFKSLKESMIGYMLNKIYSADGELNVNDVKFMTAYSAGQKEAGETNTGHYNVYLQLTPEAAAKTWYKTADKTENDKFVDANEVNNYLASSLGKAQIYKGGRTYYYFPVSHLGKIGGIGEYGIVRNHLYNCQISSIIGLGTPVFDPAEPIWPEHPVDEDTYIAAKINVLSWRLVNQKVELAW